MAVINLGVQDLQDLELRFIVYHNWWQGRLESIGNRVQDSWLQHGDMEDRVYSAKNMEKHGVHHQLTAPHTLQQNGIAERGNWTIAEAAQAMMQSAGLSQAFWEFAVTTAVHVQNHAPSRVTGNISPHEWLIKQPPDISYLCIFGCLAYTHTTTQRSKFDPTSQKLVFVGYDNSTKGYKLCNPSSHKIVTSTDVVFEKIYFSSPHPEASQHTAEFHPRTSAVTATRTS